MANNSLCVLSFEELLPLTESLKRVVRRSCASIQAEEAIAIARWMTTLPVRAVATQCSLSDFTVSQSLTR
jgi:hypothetical protein